MVRYCRPADAPTELYTREPRCTETVFAGLTLPDSLVGHLLALEPLVGDVEPAVVLGDRTHDVIGRR